MKDGFTTVELLVAIVIASIVTTLGFTVYGQMTKHFSHQGASAQKLSEVLLAKKRIDNYCNNILLVHNCSGNTATIKTRDGDQHITIRKSGNALIAGTDTLVEHIDSYSFDIVKGKKRDTKKSVLCWEAVIGGEWACGAVEVRN